MLTRSLLIILMLGNLAACAPTPRDESPPIPKFESIAIVNMRVSAELKARFGVVQEDAIANPGVMASAIAGASIAAESSFESCWDVLGCAMFSVPAGAIIGAISGGLSANAANSQNKLSREQLLVLDGLFAQILQQRIINQDIERSLMQQIPAERLTEIEDADTLLQYRVYDVRFAHTSSNQYALTLKTVMLFGWNRNSSRAVSTHRTYEHSSQSLPIEDWAQDDGTTLNQAFDSCIAGLTEQMLADIQFANP